MSQVELFIAAVLLCTRKEMICDILISLLSALQHFYHQASLLCCTRSQRNRNGKRKRQCWCFMHRFISPLAWQFLSRSVWQAHMIMLFICCSHKSWVRSVLYKNQTGFVSVAPNMNSVSSV